ncbi:MAG TPA: hypothetical protein VE173_16300, partial [Longimicrobiales bacterium]|nr:hypothetical protein [Longimicrobiales bacterium]
MFKRSLLTASAILALAAAPALAQQHPQGGTGGHPGMMGPGMMGPGMMGPGMMGYGMMGQMAGPMMGYGMMMSGKPQPAMLLQASERLELTDEQVGRLTELQQQVAEQVQQDM